MSQTPPGPVRPFPLFGTALALFLLAVILAVYAGLTWRERAVLTAEAIVLRDERRTLENQLIQLRREYLDKENALREREKALSAAEQQRLTDELTRLQREQRRLELATLAEALQTELRTAARNPAIDVLSETDRFIIRFPESTLFQPGEIAVSRSGETLLTILKPHWSGPWQGAMTEIEVHSDPTPPPASVRSRFPSNWEWTAARAGAIARVLETLDPLIAHTFRPVGCGHAAAALNDPPPAGPRRIDLIILFPQ